MDKCPGHVRITDVGVYPSLTPAVGSIVACQIQELNKGGFVYHVEARSLITLGCDVGEDNLPFPFYSNEVEVVSTG